MSKPARLFNIADILVSTVDKHTKEHEIPVRLCNYVDVYKNELITNDLDFMTATCTPDELQRFRIRVGDVLFTKDSETADDIGIPAYIESTADDLVCGYHLAIARPYRRLVYPKFLFWQLNSKPAFDYWNTRANGVTRVGLRQDDIRHIPLGILPGLDTQRAIAEFLDHETAQIDAMLSAIGAGAAPAVTPTRNDASGKSLITLLRERRSALIDGAVTGRIDPVTGKERPQEAS